MSRILVLAESGFGKTFSMGAIKELDHKGLNSKETFLISVTDKDLSFPGWNKNYVLTTPDELSKGNRIITNDATVIAKSLRALAHEKSPFKLVVIDDFNYIMQDYYMANAMKGGWDTPKKIGEQINNIFTAMDELHRSGRDLIVLAHSEVEKLPDGRFKHKMKTTGRMVDEYITPEGKFDITLIGASRFDATTKMPVREFLVREGEHHVGAKTPWGVFPMEVASVKNDLGLIYDAVQASKQ